MLLFIPIFFGMFGIKKLKGYDLEAQMLLTTIEDEDTIASVRQTARNNLKNLYLSGQLSDFMMDEIEEKCSYML
jgi:hypothetical protein